MMITFPFKGSDIKKGNFRNGPFWLPPKVSRHWDLFNIVIVTLINYLIVLILLLRLRFRSSY